MYMSTPSIQMMIIFHNQVHALAVGYIYNIFVPCAMQLGVVQGFVRPNKNAINLCQHRIVENNRHID